MLLVIKSYENGHTDTHTHIHASQTKLISRNQACAGLWQHICIHTYVCKCLLHYFLVHN